MLWAWLFGAAQLTLPISTCPHNCSLQGVCRPFELGHRCVCYPGFSGPACADVACPNHCSGHGVCADGKCKCEAGRTGTDCSRHACPAACSGRGHCTRDGCVCEPGWHGPACSYGACPDDCFHAKGQGTCKQGRCECALGFSGPNCNATCGAAAALPPPAAAAAPLPAGGNTSSAIAGGGTWLCAGRGRCAANKRCECDPGYAGASCEARTCLMGCAVRCDPRAATPDGRAGGRAHLRR